MVACGRADRKGLPDGLNSRAKRWDEKKPLTDHSQRLFMSGARGRNWNSTARGGGFGVVVGRILYGKRG